MKVALVHELLTMKGGAERVLRVLADMFPDAPIYTFLYDEAKLGEWFPKERVRVSHLQKWANRLPLGARRYNHHLYLPFFPRAAERWSFDGAQDDIADFDLVISSSSAFAHGIITNGKPKHLCYVHSPARYLWDRTHDVLAQADQGFFGPMKRDYLSRIFHSARIWDSEAADRPDQLLAASHEVQRRIQLYWRRDSTVLHPPISDFWLAPSVNHDSRFMNHEQPYFLIVSTLAAYKRLDIAIEAANQLGATLKIAGTGGAEAELKKIAAKNVEFLGFQTDDELKKLYTGATATLFPGEEDFGLVPLESMACGTPVIAYRAGGALETMIEGETGEFFDEPTPQSLLQAIRKFDHTKYSKEKLLQSASRFSQSAFEQKLYAEVERLKNT